jgi:hypothetical protein
MFNWWEISGHVLFTDLHKYQLRPDRRPVPPSEISRAWHGLYDYQWTHPLFIFLPTNSINYFTYLEVFANRNLITAALKCFIAITICLQVLLHIWQFLLSTRWIDLLYTWVIIRSRMGLINWLLAQMSGFSLNYVRNWWRVLITFALRGILRQWQNWGWERWDDGSYLVDFQ